MPPPRFLEFVVFSRVTCAHLIRSCFCRFCCDVAAAARRASPVQAAKSSSQTILHPSLPKTALPNVHMFVDTTVLFTFASYDKQPLDRRQHSACAAGLCTLSPAAIVVSLQYSLRFSRRLLTPSRCAGKISVRILSFWAIAAVECCVCRRGGLIGEELNYLWCIARRCVLFGGCSCTRRRALTTSISSRPSFQH